MARQVVDPAQANVLQRGFPKMLLIDFCYSRFICPFHIIVFLCAWTETTVFFTPLQTLPPPPPPLPLPPSACWVRRPPRQRETGVRFPLAPWIYKVVESLVPAITPFDFIIPQKPGRCIRSTRDKSTYLSQNPVEQYTRNNDRCYCVPESHTSRVS